MRPSDSIRNVFQARGTNIGENGTVKRAVLGAQKRGIIFDACNGSNHFAVDVAVPARAGGFCPDVSSTDLTVKTLGRSPVAALPYILSKYIALGCELPRIINAATAVPAKLMGLEGKIGTLAPGAFGDVAVFQLRARPVTFADTFTKTVQGNAMLVPVLTVSEGQMLYRSLDFI